MSPLIFSQLDAGFQGLRLSDLTSDTEGPFASLQTVKVPQESNTVACCHDERPTGKPDEHASTYNRPLKGRDGGVISEFVLCIYRQIADTLIRIKDKKKTFRDLNIQQRTPDWNEEAFRDTFMSADVWEFQRVLNIFITLDVKTRDGTREHKDKWLKISG